MCLAKSFGAFFFPEVFSVWRSLATLGPGLDARTQSPTQHPTPHIPHNRNNSSVGHLGDTPPCTGYVDSDMSLCYITSGRPFAHYMSLKSERIRPHHPDGRI